MTADAPPEPAKPARDREAGKSLASALDAAFSVEAAAQAAFPERIGRLAFELTGARAVTVVSDAPGQAPLHAFGMGGQTDQDEELARRAFAEGRVVSRPPDAIAFATETPTGMRFALIAVMPPGNAVLASLAFERMEFLHALCRSQDRERASALPAPVLQDAAATASGDWERAQALADGLSRTAGGAVVAIVALANDSVVISGRGDLPARADLPASYRTRAQAAAAQPTPAPGVRLLGAPAASYALFVDAPEPLVDALANPVVSVFAGAANRPGWRRKGRTTVKVAAVALVLAAIGAIPIGDGVNLPATAKAVSARIVTAPFDGRIAEILVREGDAVTAGETVLMRMDRSELETMLAEARAEVSAAATRRDSLRGRANAADRREAEFDVRREALKAKALEDKLALAEVRATIDGVVQGDSLGARSGAFVGLGGEIMRVIDPRQIQIETAVSPKARARIAAGDTATFRADSAPNDAIEIQLINISASPLEEGPDPIYPALSAPLENAEALRPGMQGVARFSFDDAPLALVMWRRLRDWALLTFWL